MESKRPSPPAVASAVPGKRLLEQLARARRRRCVLVLGPAGSGKTTMLQTWRVEWMVMGIDVAWLALDAGHNDFQTFAAGVLDALSEIDTVITKEASLLAGHGQDAEAVESMVIALVQGLTAHRREVVLILDDAHHLRDERILQALQLLLDYLPQNLQCVLASRTPVPLSLARLRATDQLMELGFQDLRLPFSESRELLRSHLGAISDHEARTLHSLADGWVAGLQLLCVGRRLRRGAARSDGERVRTPEAFSSFFEREVLAQLSAEELRFLVYCAVPKRFNPTLAAALLGTPDALAESAALLTRLKGEVLFIMAADEAGSWWRMHPLLREVLLARFGKLPLNEQQQVHRTAWRWFAEQGSTHEAVRHAVMAGEAEAAADLVERSASRHFVEGNLYRVIALVRELPRDLLQQRPDLRLCIAWSELDEHRYDACAQSIAQMQRDLADADGQTRFRLTLLRGVLAIQTDDTEAAMALVPELLNPPAGADDLALSGGRNILSWLYLYRGDYELARRVPADAVSVLEGLSLVGTPFGALTAKCFVGLSYALEGQMLLAERLYREVLQQASGRGASCIDAACLATALLGEALLESNDVQGASDLLENQIDLLERISIPDGVMRGMIVLARARLLAGRPLDALSLLERLEEYAERFKLDRLLAHSLVEQLRVHLRRDDVGSATACMDRLDELDTRHANAAPGALRDVAIAAERGRVHMCVYRGDYHSALTRLDALSARCLQRGRLRSVAQLHIQSAAIERRLGRPEQVRAHVREALRLGHRLGLVRILLDAHEDAPLLIDESIREGTLEPVLSFYATRLATAARSSIAAPGSDTRAPRSGIDADLSEREAEIVRLLILAMPNKKIARALGLSYQTIKWHLKNIYSKLGVSGRDEVVVRMRNAGAVQPQTGMDEA